MRVPSIMPETSICPRPLFPRTLFYLRARGIPAEEARHMLVAGFLREPVDTIADAAIRDHLLARLTARLAKLEG